MDSRGTVLLEFNRRFERRNVRNVNLGRDAWFSSLVSIVLLSSSLECLNN